MKTLIEVQAAEAVTKREAAIEAYLRAHQNLDYIANKWLILEGLGNSPVTVENLDKVVEFLGLGLAVKSPELIQSQQTDEAERQRHQEEQEREALIEAITTDWSQDKFAQDIQRNKLKWADTKSLREKVQVIHDRKRFRAMPPDELKQWLRTQREQK